MKFMDQSLFEVNVLTLAGWKAQSIAAYDGMKVGIHDVYHPSFPGDSLWYRQVLDSVDDALATAEEIAAGKESKLLLLAAEIRKQLNDDLAPISGLMAKLGLKGTYFTKSHPAPSSRPEIAAGNIRLLLIRLNNSAYRPS